MDYKVSNEDNGSMDVDGTHRDIRRGTKRSYIDMYGPLRKQKHEVPTKITKN